MNDVDNLNYLKNLSILYVEDDDRIRGQLCQFLARRCAKLYLAENGEEGLKRFEEHRPDIIITDILMPVMDGLKMGEAIRANYPKVPIIITTAFEEPRYFHRAIDLNVDKYVTKPVNLDKLEVALLKCAHAIRAEFALQESQQRAAELFKSQSIAAVVFESQEGMFVTDETKKILRINKAFTEITGYTEEDIIGKTPAVLRSNHHDTDFYSQMWESINRLGYWKGEIRNKRKNGEVFIEKVCITMIKDSEDNVTNYVAIFSDVTVSKAIADEIEHLAFYDQLTDLPNRRLLFDRLKMESSTNKRSGKKSALLFVDMDNFKSLNDTLGHDIGDLLLQQVASRLRECVRDCDTVARLGGDEFVVMLNDLNENNGEAKKQSELIGQKILATLNKNYQLNEYNYHSTPSIGITLFDGHEISIEVPLKQADLAMYKAKNSGRNTLCFFEDG
jgi:diguanylate cyclase (GGDEF)-like protein/PAS domain S-box-containing protein